MQREFLINKVGEVRCEFDATGIGMVPAQDLSNFRPNFQPHVYSNTSKTDMMRGLQISLEQKEVFFPKGHIEEELKSFEYKLTTGGRVTWGAPSGLHDDCVNALALCVRAKNLSKFQKRAVFVG